MKKPKYETKIKCPHCHEAITIGISDEKLYEESEEMKKQREGFLNQIYRLREENRKLKEGSKNE